MIEAEKGTKTVGKKSSGFRSLDRSSGKLTGGVSRQQRNQRNFAPTTSGVQVSSDCLRQSQNDISLRQIAGTNACIELASAGVHIGQLTDAEAPVSLSKEKSNGQTLHSRLADIKEQLNPLIDA